MASINFLYRSTKPESYLNLRLLFRIHSDGIKDHVIGAKTKLKVSKEYWVKQHNKKSKDIDIINRQKEVKSELMKIESFILEEFEKENPSLVNKKWLQSKLELYYNPKGQKRFPKDLVSYIDFYIEDRKNDISKASEKKFKVVQNKMERFQIERGSTLLIAEIGGDFKNEFQDYYLKEKYSQNTMNRELKFIKTFCRHARYHGLEVHFQLEDMNLKKETIKSPYLSFEEITQIEKAELETEYQENARDWLIISCFTGQRVSDFLRFESNMIRVEDGKQLLEFKQQKTGKLMTIPVHSKVKAILEKRGGEFPRKISDQRYNEYIKEVCKLAGINEMVTGRKKVNINPNKKERAKYRVIEAEYPKWDLVSSHIGRRSFCTNHYGKIPTSHLMYISGHSTEALFLEYIGKSSKDLALELANYF
ncbi:phage integrase SAM-like domain-containing protein [Maribacter polysaccharolyticus]|uniref:phage integrase SAM-like domain-containing protein n=1 Tax=Maribacter polysaccharolyticus TaxID=3020831 RepID=UPI00237F28EA|nr:phage integrase SAM-like domain-containing protein [Maribacter polysaccharolyticus]MDE3741665.1 phage integrase SAM-like domain-containing protein [Maribacter polysaccharolyticus]